MSLPTTIKGSSYVDIRTRLYYMMRKANGEGEIGAGETYANLSNGELLALVQAWKRAAARSSRPSWPLWYELSLSALGWGQTGDRFVMTKEHARAPAEPYAIRLFWISTDELAIQLDDAGTKLYPLIVDWTMDGYRQAAKDAWREMAALKPSAPSPIPPVAPTPPEPVLPEVPVPSMSDSGLLLLALLIAAWISHKRRD